MICKEDINNTPVQIETEKGEMLWKSYISITKKISHRC